MEANGVDFIGRTAPNDHPVEEGMNSARSRHFELEIKTHLQNAAIEMKTS